MQPLPIDSLLGTLADTLRANPCVVLEAPPGAGKTTRVPRALYDHGFAENGEILVLEPRRIATRMAARRVAEELGESVGDRVGYQMRFEEVTGPRTRIRFMTEGTLTRRLLRDRTLDGVAAVVLDEFHERHLEGDLALSLLRRLQLGPRPDLRLVVMSATLDAESVSAFLGNAPRLRSEGKRFDVAVDHLVRTDSRPQETLVLEAVRRLVDEGLEGDVLVFLPGMAEIRRALEASAPFARRADLELHRLHGALPPAEQDRAIRASDRRKVIFATNVAETSITIDGVVAVVDTGLARTASYAPWSGFSALAVTKISQASATQRAGRAGRTRPGRCLRLYTKGDLGTRPSHDVPEVARADLSQALLELLAAEVTDISSFAWLDPPPNTALQAALRLLTRLGGIEEAPSGARLSATGRRMLRFPLHPRLSRIVIEAERRGHPEAGAAIAAILGERDLYASSHRHGDASHASDVLALLSAFEQASAAGFDGYAVEHLGVDIARAQSAARAEKQLLRLVDRRPARGSARLAAPPSDAEPALLACILAGYPDRVGRLRRPANATGRTAREVVLATGGTVLLAESSGVREADLVVVVDAEERSESGGGTRVVARIASAASTDDLLEMFTETILDTTDHVWNEAAERVDVVRRLSYDALVLEETRGLRGTPEVVARVLADAAQRKGWRALVQADGFDNWLARVAFARRVAPDVDFPSFDDEAMRSCLADFCEGLSSFAEIRQNDLTGFLRRRLSPKATQVLEDVAPVAITLPGGRRLSIDYAAAAPSVKSRLQDFFGMATGPTVARGRVPLVLHLLAPNQRDVQITTDLAGFWEKHYPAIARELRRRYPRHAWPDNPRTALPPEPRRR